MRTNLAICGLALLCVAGQAVAQEPSIEVARIVLTEMRKDVARPEYLFDTDSDGVFTEIRATHIRRVAQLLAVRAVSFKEIVQCATPNTPGDCRLPVNTVLVRFGATTTEGDTAELAMTLRAQEATGGYYSQRVVARLVRNAGGKWVFQKFIPIEET